MGKSKQLLSLPIQVKPPHKDIIFKKSEVFDILPCYISSPEKSREQICPHCSQIKTRNTWGVTQ